MNSSPLQAEKTQSENAQRIAKHRDKQLAQGKAQLNINLPIHLHGHLKLFATRIKNGMSEFDAAQQLLNEIAEENISHHRKDCQIRVIFDMASLGNCVPQKERKSKPFEKIKRYLKHTPTFRAPEHYSVTLKQRQPRESANIVRINPFGFDGGPVVTADRRNSVRCCTAAIRGVLLHCQELLRSQFWSRRSC